MNRSDEIVLDLSREDRAGCERHNGGEPWQDCTCTDRDD